MQYAIEEFYKAKCVNKLRREFGEELEIERIAFQDSSILKVSLEYGIGEYLDDVPYWWTRLEWRNFSKNTVRRTNSRKRIKQAK